MKPRDERMGAFDAVMYGIEGDPLLRSPIIAFVLLDGTPEVRAVADRTEYVTRMFPRLRQRAVGSPFSPAPPRWEPDPNFDPDYHVRWRRLPGEPDVHAALDYAARMAEQDFDRQRPLWEIAVLTDLVDDQSAVVIKIHHSIADGMGGLEMSAALFDLVPDPPQPEPIDAPPLPAASGAVDRARQAAAFEAGALREVVTGSVGLSLRTARWFVQQPVTATVRTGRTGVAALNLLAPQGAPHSRWMTERSMTCQFSLLRVPLADVKRTAREAQTTVNVVFLGAVAEAVGRYHRANGYELPSMRVNMPISIRTPEDAATGNHWVPARFVVPTQEIPLEHRLYQLDGLVHTARKDPALKLADGVYKALALLPDPVTSRIAGALMKGVDVAATNVPGPPVPVYLCGSRVRAIIPFAPKSGAALNISFMSYDEDAFIGINADPAAVEDPAEFVRHLADAFDELTQARLTPGAE